MKKTNNPHQNKIAMRSLLLLTFALLFSGWQSVQAQCVVTPVPDSIQIACGDTVTLSANAIGGTAAISNDFNLGVVGPGWNISPAGVFTNPCGPGLDGTTHMWMGNTTAAPREMQTVPLDVACGGTICFDLRFSIQGQASPCEGPDLTTEGVYLEWNTGGGWNQIFYFQPNTSGSFNSESPGSGDYTAWAQYCFAIPAAAATPSTQFRWYQGGSSGNGFDHWGIDNVQIYSTCDPYFYVWEMVSQVQDTTVIPGQDTVYNVMYTNFIDDSCFAQVIVDIIEPMIDVFPDDSILCQGDALQFGMNTVGVPSTAGQGDFTWSPPTGLSDPTIPDPIAGPLSTTTYIVDYVNSDAPNCTASDTVTINVAPGFTHTITVDNPSPCLGEDIGIDIDITGGSTGYSFEWVPATYLDDAFLEDPTVSGAPNGNYTYYVYISSPAGCVRLDSINFDVAQAFPPDIEAAASDSAVCPGDSLQLTVIETNFNPNMQYYWLNGNGTISDSLIWNPMAAPNGSMMYVVYGVDTATGCDAYDTVWVDNYPNPVFTITGTPDQGYAPLDVDFSWSGDSLVVWYWQIGDTTNVSTISEPSNTFENPGTYWVSLHASNEWGCEGMATTTIVVWEDLSSYIWIPNVFSPNGDGVNDEWYITNEGIVEFECEIYNRWGKKVHTWSDISTGWDGNIGGSKAAEGTYYFRIRAVGEDETVHTEHGSFTLLRGK